MNRLLVLFLVILISCKTNTALKSDIKQVYNVRDYGAVGDGVTDDTKAIQACFTKIDKNARGTAYFPKGIYKVSRTNIAGKSWCLQAVNNLSIKGEDKTNTIIQLADNQKNFTRMLVLDKNNFVNITNITFNGNLENQNNPNNPNEHLGGIFINQSSNIKITNSNFINTGGDGIGIRGVKEPSSNIHISNCFFDNNQRNGITLGSGFDGVEIINNTFGKHIDDSPIDTEPTSGVCQNVLIQGNTINTSSLLTLGGASDLNPGRNFIVKDNKLSNCSIFIVHGDSIIIKNNILLNKTPQKAAITCLGGNNAIYIDDNSITSHGKPAFYFVKVRYSDYFPRNIHITNNAISILGNKNNAFNIRGAKDVFISHNTLKGANANMGIYCLSNASMDNININDNTINGFNTGIRIQALKNNTIKNVTIKKNSFNNVKTPLNTKLTKNQHPDLLENLKVE